MTSIVPKVSSSADQTAWFDAVKSELQGVENRMREVSHMGQRTLDSAVEGIITAGGKRMRPALAILMGRLFDADQSHTLSVAASIELLHTATLVHDDLIDGADERRGAPTVHSQLPLGITVLTGDFLFAQAAQLAAQANSVEVVKLFSETLVKICQGEILQAQTRWEIPSNEVYENRIYGKTAALFEASTTSPALLTGASLKQIDACSSFGRNLGLAFQIVDDALDFMATTAQLGKPSGHDMRQGIFNLPAVFYVEAGYIEVNDLMRRVENADRVDELVKHIRDTGMVEKSLAMARDYIHAATKSLESLPQNSASEYLSNLTEYALSRTY